MNLIYALRLTLTLVFIILVSCSTEENTIAPDSNTSGNESGDNDTSGDGTGQDQGGNSEYCQPTGEDYVLNFTYDGWYYYNPEILIIDQNLAVVRRESLPTGQEVTLTIPDAGQETYLVLLKSNSTYDHIGLFLTDLPQGSYRFYRENPIARNYIHVNFDIQQLGELPVLVRNRNYYLKEVNYAPDNGGTYHFGTSDDNLARRFYPPEKGYFLSLRSDNESSDRYYWSTNPPNNNTPGTLDFQQLPFVDQHIDLSVPPEVSDYGVYQYNIFGFVPGNNSRTYGNIIGYYKSEYNYGQGLTYSMPNNLFERYRFHYTYETENVRGHIEANQQQPVTDLPMVPMSVQVTNNNISDYSANTTGDYDAFKIYYSTYIEDPSTYLLQDVQIYGPKKSLINYNIRELVETFLPEMFPYLLDYIGTTLISSSAAECYPMFVMHSFDDQLNPEEEEYSYYHRKP